MPLLMPAQYPFHKPVCAGTVPNEVEKPFQDASPLLTLRSPVVHKAGKAPSNPSESRVDCAPASGTSRSIKQHKPTIRSTARENNDPCRNPLKSLRSIRQASKAFIGNMKNLSRQHHPGLSALSRVSAELEF